MSDRDLRAPVRGQSVGDKQMQRGSFPFDAWEMDNARTNPSPVLELKSPWTLKLSGLTSSDITVSNLTITEEVNLPDNLALTVSDLTVKDDLVVSGSAKIGGGGTITKISWGTASAPTLSLGNIYLQHEA